jgi:hypothetical protein
MDFHATGRGSATRKWLECGTKLGLQIAQERHLAMGYQRCNGMPACNSNDSVTSMLPLECRTYLPSILKAVFTYQRQSPSAAQCGRDRHIVIGPTVENSDRLDLHLFIVAVFVARWIECHIDNNCCYEKIEIEMRSIWKILTVMTILVQIRVCYVRFT